MKRLLPLLALAAAAALPVSRPQAAEVVGVRTLSVPVPERGGTMDVTLWYPAAPGGEPVLVGDNAFFQGVPARRDAPAATGSRPLILQSQGGLRSGPNIGAWLASIWPGLDASGLARAVSDARYDTVPGATQFSAFGECKPQAAVILRAEGEEPLCDDTGGRSRAEIHVQLAAMVEAAFRQNFSR